MREDEERGRPGTASPGGLLAFPPFALDLAKELRLFSLQLVEKVEPGLEGLGIDIEAFAQVPILLVKEGAVLAQVGRDQFVAQFLVMRHAAQSPADDGLELAQGREGLTSSSSIPPAWRMVAMSPGL